MNIAGQIALSIPVAAFAALVFQQGWGWFVVPLGAQRLDYAHSIGLMLLIGYINAKRDTDRSEDAWAENIAHQIILSIVSLALMWIVHFFLP